MPFYSAYLLETGVYTAKLDIWLLFSLFILIPVLNKSKIEEANSGGLVIDYVRGMKNSWLKIALQELLICIGISVVAMGSVITGHTSKNDIVNIILPLMVGMLLIASVPNYVQLLCFSDKFSSGLKTAIVISVVAIAVYCSKLLYSGFAVPLLFVLSSFLYCVIGTFVARSMNLLVSDFWRWKSALFLIILSCGLMGLVNLNC